MHPRYVLILVYLFSQHLRLVIGTGILVQVESNLRSIVDNLVCMVKYPVIVPLQVLWQQVNGIP